MESIELIDNCEAFKPAHKFLVGIALHGNASDQLSYKVLAIKSAFASTFVYPNFPGLRSRAVLAKLISFAAGLPVPSCRACATEHIVVQIRGIALNSRAADGADIAAAGQKFSMEH